MTIDEMKDYLKSLGLKRKYYPYQENTEKELPVILLKSRRPLRFKDGIMSGVEADVWDAQTIRVWTSRKAKANAIANANGFRIKLLDHEAELFIPVDKADQFLHGLGIAVVPNRKPLSEERKKALRERLSTARNARSLRSGHTPRHVLEINPQTT